MGTAITDDASHRFVTASVSVGGTAVQLSASSILTPRGVTVRSDVANTGKIYLGPAATVTIRTNPATDGYELSPGESKFIPIDDVAKIWAIATVAAQVLSYEAS